MAQDKGPVRYNHAFFKSLTCPTKVTWTANIQKMFTSTDVSHMKQVTGGALDLSNYSSVKVWASKIYSEVAGGAMPPPGSGENPWTSDMVNTFGCWIQQGCPQ
ncbi:MAG TPA: hypothetical protein VNH64_10140 [Parvularculaceae bacterium]|nr:hypothetical protein [Parvularculaceae bacterium]